jgi:predicted site-specific integrase-resolvase
MTLLMPREVDRMLRYPRGRALRLARAGLIPVIRLPDGELRFDEGDIAKLLTSQQIVTEIQQTTEAVHA